MEVPLRQGYYTSQRLWLASRVLLACQHEAGQGFTWTQLLAPQHFLLVVRGVLAVAEGTEVRHPSNAIKAGQVIKDLCPVKSTSAMIALDGPTELEAENLKNLLHGTGTPRSMTSHWLH
jgi:hypothetical protein